MTEKEKMLLGKLYNASDAELQKELKRCRKLTRLFNNSTEEDIEYRSKLLKDLFGKVGVNIFVSLHLDVIMERISILETILLQITIVLY